MPDHAHFAFDAEIKGFRWAGASDFVANRWLSLVKPDGKVVRDVVAGFGGKKRFVRITTESGTLMVKDADGQKVLTHTRSEVEVTDVVPLLRSCRASA